MLIELAIILFFFAWGHNILHSFSAYMAERSVTAAQIFLGFLVFLLALVLYCLLGARLIMWVVGV